MRMSLLLILAACSSAPKPHTPPSAAPATTTGQAAPIEADAKRDAGVIDPALAARAQGFVDAFTNTGAVFTADGKRVVFTSNRDGLPQLYIASTNPDEPAQRLLATTERIGAITGIAPGGKDVLFTMDHGADEQWSLYRVGLDGKRLVELTPGAKLSRDEPLIPDGKPSTMYFTARAMSEAKSTLYAASATAATPVPKPIYTDELPMSVVDVSQDGAFALAVQYPTRAENTLLRIDLASGKAEKLFPPSGAVSILEAKLSRDGTRAIVATDLGAEQMLVLAIDAKTGKQLAKHAVTPATAQIDRLALAKRGGTLAYTLLVGNHSEIHLLDARTLAVRATIAMPPGQGYALDFTEDGKRLVAQWSTPSVPTDLFSIEVASGKVTPLRSEPRPSLAAMPAVTTTLTDIPAFDGGKIPTHVLTPAGDPAKPRPVIVSYHGGPAGTSVIRWNAIYAFYLSLGYIIVEPNVRGSSGYGRAYEAADNGPKRLDAFKDIEASARWVAAQPWADKDRLVVYGGSYGGYTTLIALSRWPELWRAGIDLFGVVNLKTFMATTSGVIRKLFLVEFGDPDKDAAFLASISPLTNVDKIVDPTFVYAGANDPRVPVTESDLIVKALRQRKVPSEYMVADNEGHSLAREENLVAFLARSARFLAVHLK